MNTYYTSNICRESYCSIRLICLANNVKEAKIFFDKYIDNRNKCCSKEYIIKQLLEGKIKNFTCIE